MRIASAALAALLLVTPIAAAGPQPALYFFKDGELGPLGPGVLNATLPDGLDPSVRPIVVGTEEAPTALFLASDPHPGRLYGPVFLFLWPGPTVVHEGNMTATLYLAAPGSDVTLPGSGLTPLASASISVDFNASTVPDPMVLIPPDPTDPEAAVAHILAQILLMTLQPPSLFYFGLVDVEVPEDHNIAIGVYLESAEGDLLPVPIGAGSLQYDGQLMPSLAYVPWYAPDPPRPEPEPTRTPPAGSPGPGSEHTPSPSPASGDGSRGTPAAGLVAATLALLGAVLVLRRRS